MIEPAPDARDSLVKRSSDLGEAVVLVCRRSDHQAATAALIVESPVLGEIVADRCVGARVGQQGGDPLPGDVDELVV
jgi:hypothetical protein